MNKNLQHESNISDNDINIETKNRIESNFPTKNDSTWEECKEVIPKIIQWLDSERRKDKTRFFNVYEIKSRLGIRLLPQRIRKLIQLYRENANDDVFTNPTHSAITGGKYGDHIQFYGMIIATSKGYKFSRDIEEIEKYAETTIAKRRISLNKQTLAAEIITANLKENKKVMNKWQLEKEQKHEK